MTQQLDDLISVASRELEDINDLTELETWRVRHLGKKSQLTTVLRGHLYRADARRFRFRCTLLSKG